MRLTRITITGADDNTDLGGIRSLTDEFPFVEWGVLGSVKRSGMMPRYPSFRQMDGITRAALGQMAFHCCGAEARRILEGDGPPVSEPTRYQLNGFSKFEEEHSIGSRFRDWVASVADVGCEVILQVNTLRAQRVAGELNSFHPNVSALWDQSAGEGVCDIDAWPDPGPVSMKHGYAGGLGPDTIERACAWVTSLAPPHEAWLDLESGVRSDNELDFDKVRRVLEIAARFIVKV